MDLEERKKGIMTATIIGIITNVVLGALKVFIGVVSHSIAIISDGANNATDSLSSIVTLIGYKLSLKRPNKSHPLGFGRIEYISAMMVAFIVIFTGLTFLEESIKAIIHPEEIIISALLIIILISTIFVKLFLWRLNVSIGKKVNSEALQASGTDAISDAITALITIISAIINKYSGLHVDGYAGIIVSLFIIYNGCISMKGTFNALLGGRPKKTIVNKLTEIINRFPPLHGCYDIMIHNYGPMESFGSCNVEVPEDVKTEKIFDAIVDAKESILKTTGIDMTIGMLAVNNTLPEVKTMEKSVLAILKTIEPHVLSIHAFHIHFKRKVVHFDIVVDFALTDIKGFREKTKVALEKHFPDYSFEYNIDPDYA